MGTPVIQEQHQMLAGDDDALLFRAHSDAKAKQQVIQRRHTHTFSLLNRGESQGDVQHRKPVVWLVGFSVLIFLCTSNYRDVSSDIGASLEEGTAALPNATCGGHARAFLLSQI